MLPVKRARLTVGIIQRLAGKIRPHGNVHGKHRGIRAKAGALPLRRLQTAEVFKLQRAQAHQPAAGLPPDPEAAVKARTAKLQLVFPGHAVQAAEGVVQHLAGNARRVQPNGGTIHGRGKHTQARKAMVGFILPGNQRIGGVFALLGGGGMLQPVNHGRELLPRRRLPQSTKAHRR